MKKILNSPYAVGGILSFHFIIWYTATFFLDVHPDMADHWMWSRFFSFGYYEHPPMVAWTMWLVDLLPIGSIAAMEFGAILNSVIIFYLAYRVGRFFYGHKAGIILLLTLESTPYFSMASVFWHIDQPYMMCWLLGMLVIGKYIETDNPKWLLVFGVIAGIGALSKYIILLFYISLFFWCIFDKSKRHLLISPYTWGAGLISFIIWLPNLYWNYTNEWATFNYNLSKGGGASYFGKNVIPFTTGHLALFSLILAPICWYLLAKRKIFVGKITSKETFLLSNGLFVAAFFTMTSFKGGHADPHWLNTGYFALFTLMSPYILKEIEEGKLKKWNKIFVSSYALLYVALVLAFTIFYTPLLTTPWKSDPTAKLVGWEKTGDQIEDLVRKNNLKLPRYTVTREYQLGGVLGLYMKSHPFSHSIEKPIRNEWSKVEDVAKEGAIILCPVHECKKTIPKVQNRFKNNKIKKLGKFDTYANTKLLRKAEVYYLLPTK